MTTAIFVSCPFTAIVGGMTLQCEARFAHYGACRHDHMSPKGAVQIRWYPSQEERTKELAKMLHESQESRKGKA